MVDCTEIGPASTANASAFYRTRIHEVEIMAGETRCLVANFNGAINKARTIASIKWRQPYGYIAAMSNAQIQSDNRSASVLILGNALGDAYIQCEATLDNGEVYVQPFHVDVSGNPLLAPNNVSGPIELDA